MEWSHLSGVVLFTALFLIMRKGTAPFAIKLSFLSAFIATTAFALFLLSGLDIWLQTVHANHPERLLVTTKNIYFFCGCVVGWLWIQFLP